jgi:ESX secretion system protein EccE
VATSVMGGRDVPDLATAGRPMPKVRTRPIRHGRLFGIRAGQIVSTQVAGVAVLIGATTGTLALAAAVAFAIILLALTWLRMHGRWAFEWLDIALRFAGRRRTAAVDAAPTALLEFVAPGSRVDRAAPGSRVDRAAPSSRVDRATLGSRVDRAALGGDAAAVIVDGTGLTTVVELGDPAGLLAEELHGVPSPAELLPPADADHPPCRIQLLLSGVPAPAIRAGSGTPANSYRQLTEGRLLGHNRALLAVRVLRAEGWSEEDLRQALSSLVRKLSKRLGAVPARPLGAAAAVGVIAEMAHDDGAGSAQETWPGLQVGGLAQATYRLQRWPDPRIETSRRLITRMLALPAAATTVALTAGPRSEQGTGDPPITMIVRLAGPDTAALGTAAQALRKLLAAEHASARRLDGEHLDGLAATLPLGGMDVRELPGRPVEHSPPARVVDGLDLTIGPAGLMIGNNRQGGPVVARSFRPEQTRALMVGGFRCAQLLALRAMALGARVVVQTARPHVWEPFVRGAAVPGESIAVIPPGRSIGIAAGSALYPVFLVVDVGPVGADTRPGAGWQATLVVRDEFTAADVDLASRADLLLLQPLRPEEATLVGTALGLGDTAQWLTRIRADMLGVVNRRAVRWVALAQTPIESQLIGPPVRG